MLHWLNFSAVTENLVSIKETHFASLFFHLPTLLQCLLSGCQVVQLESCPGGKHSSAFNHFTRRVVFVLHRFSLHFQKHCTVNLPLINNYVHLFNLLTRCASWSEVWSWCMKGRSWHWAWIQKYILEPQKSTGWVRKKSHMTEPWLQYLCMQHERL